MGTEQDKLALEHERLALERHKHIRDEQFWFTTAIVAFNVYLINKADHNILVCLTVLGSCFIGFHLVMT